MASKLIFRLATVAVLLASTACSSREPDIVASRPDSGNQGFNPQDAAVPCKTGVYEGLFNGSIGPEDSSSPFAGQISFTLELKASGEFYEITNSTLDGVANSGTITFDADVSGDGTCQAGDFDARLDGTFTVLEMDYEFGGPITGEYNPDNLAFTGRWEASQSDGNPIGRGTWIALWKED